MISDAIQLLRKHGGEFLCRSIGSDESTKIEKFEHRLTSPMKINSISCVPEISEFYKSVGSALLYFCPESEDAAFYLANPEEWEELDIGFNDWVEMLDDDEKEDALPSWFGSHKVIGEIPASGNYLLVVEADSEKGSIYMFDHDGFEFYKLGSGLAEFILTAIDPDSRFLLNMASHMRFVTDGNYHQQWWINELRHSSGKVVVNEA